MINWLLTLTNEQRKISLDEAEQLSGISAKALEKDWWVTLTLKDRITSFYVVIHKDGPHHFNKIKPTLVVGFVI